MYLQGNRVLNSYCDKCTSLTGDIVGSFGVKGSKSVEKIIPLVSYSGHTVKLSAKPWPRWCQSMSNGQGQCKAMATVSSVEVIRSRSVQSHAHGGVSQGQTVKVNAKPCPRLGRSRSYGQGEWTIIPIQDHGQRKAMSLVRSFGAIRSRSMKHHTHVGVNSGHRVKSHR